MGNYNLQIESYLLGDLSEPDLSAFKEALENDPELVLAVNQMMETQKRLAALKLRNQVSGALKDRETSVKPVKMPFKFITIATALFIALVAGIILFKIIKPDRAKIAPIPVLNPAPPAHSDTINRNVLTSPGFDTIHQRNPDIAMNDHSEKISVSEFYVPLNINSIRSVEKSNDQKSVLQQASDAFEVKNYKLVVTILQDEKKYDSDDVGIFLRAHSLFKLGQFRAAINDFKRLENSFQFKEEARWNYLLCKIATGQTMKDPETKILLNSMIDDKNFPFYNKAITLKSRLH